MMQELDQVVLTENITEHHLEAGDMGTVMLLANSQSSPPGPLSIAWQRGRNAGAFASKFSSPTASTVVLTHENSAGYMLEFMTVDGETIAVVTLHTHQVRAIAADEIAHVRRLESASA